MIKKKLWSWNYLCPYKVHKILLLMLILCNYLALYFKALYIK